MPVMEPVPLNASASAVTSYIPPSYSGKRAVDIIFCILALPLLGLASLFVAIVVGFTSPGPIFYRQERIGLCGRRFKMYKFRTMHVGASTSSHQAHFTQLINTNTPMQKLDGRGDKRLITGGWFIRASGLDELPQIINVLLGDMSIVGPRPCIPYEYDHYSSAQKRRLHALPGVTGLWQVSGKNSTTFDQMVRLDVRYAREKSLAMDLWIILMTPMVLGQEILTAFRKRFANVGRGDANLVGLELGHGARPQLGLEKQS